MPKQMNYFNKIYKIRKDSLTNTKQLNQAGIQITTICPNGCTWCCSDCKLKGRDLIINDNLKEFISKLKFIAFTGGEPLIYSGLQELINLFIKSPVNKTFANIMTSGIQPDAPSDMIKTYYKIL